MKNAIQALKVIALALILSFGISYVYAWTAPTAKPPGGNVSAPINTSVTAQYKEGAIGIGGLIRGYANAIFDGSVGIGTTAPGYKLDVAGDIRSSGALIGSFSGGQHISQLPWFNAAGAPVGYIKLITPIVDNESNMFSIKINGYQYGLSGQPTEIRCGGYAYSGLPTGSALINTDCHTEGTNLPVEIGTEFRGGSYVVVIRIGTPTTTWYYNHFTAEYVGWNAKSPSGFSWVTGEKTPAQTGNTNNVYVDDSAGTITTTGNVGIGTAAPGAKLGVSSGDASLASFGPNASWGGKLYVGASPNQGVAAAAQVISTDGNLHLDPAPSKNMYLGYYQARDIFINPNGGNVGIGKTNPGVKLDVAGQIKSTEGIDVGNAGGAYTYITMRDDESPNGVKYIHANSNVVGFLSGAGSWLSYWDNAGNQQNTGNINANDYYIRASGKWASQIGGATPPAGSSFLDTSTTAQTKAGPLTTTGLETTNRLTVGEAGGAYSFITMKDDESPTGVKYIHANSNVVGFLNSAAGWLTYWDNAGNQQNMGSISAGNNVTAAGSVTATGNVQGQHIKFPGVGGNSGAGVDYYGIYQESGPWSYPYPDLRIQYHTGIKYDAHQSYGGHQFYTGYDGSGNPAGLQMQITDKVYVSDVCTTAGKCLSAATTGASGGTFKTAQDYINAYSGKVATIPAVVAAGHWVNLIGYTWDNIYSSGLYYCNGGTSHCQSYSPNQTIKFGSDGYIYADSVPYIDAGYGYWGLYETNGANRVNNIRLCYYATPSLNTTGNGSCSISVATPYYSSGYKIVVGGWLGVEAGSRDVTISYSQNGVTVKGGLYPLTTAMFP